MTEITDTTDPTVDEPVVRREADFDAAVADVWDSLTRPELLEEWLEADVELDVRPGGNGTVRGIDGERRVVRVDDVDECRRLAFTWWSEDTDEPASSVEFVLTPTSGGTHLVVTEAPLTARACVGRVADAWTWRLDLLLLALVARVHV
jgi:uncharacterized protein YndB with AHSA1/START domain